MAIAYSMVVRAICKINFHENLINFCATGEYFVWYLFLNCIRVSTAMRDAEVPIAFWWCAADFWNIQCPPFLLWLNARLPSSPMAISLNSSLIFVEDMRRYFNLLRNIRFDDEWKPLSSMSRCGNKIF